MLTVDTVKYKRILFSLLLFAGLFGFLQFYSAYHFYYVEQNQLFQFSRFYWMERIAEPGGLCLWIGEFLVQFFAWPYAGAALTAALLTAVAGCTDYIVRRIGVSSGFYLLALLPAFALLAMHFSFNYLIQGTVAYLLCVAAFSFYIRIGRTAGRTVYAVVSIPFLFWWGGPVSGLFALCIAVWELLIRNRKGYWVLLPVVEAAGIASASLYQAWIGEYRYAFLPDFYYHPSLIPGKEIYYAWACLPVIIVAAYGLRRIPSLSGWQKAGIYGVQLLAAAALFGWVVKAYGDKGSARMKKLDYHVRTCQWDRVIDNCQGPLDNYLYLCCLNMALAEKGELADRMFAFDQRGVQGLTVTWNKAAVVSTLLSDVYFTIGDMALSQEMAFESYVSTLGAGNPRMLQRLIQTNLIYGAYPVAEKYLDILDRTLYYKDWAERHRKFLYNDTLVAEDSLLGAKRKNLLPFNYLAHWQALATDLQHIAEHNPANQTAIHYLGAMCLLAKELEPFKTLVEKYYGTEVLPVLPVSFQEAVITLSEKNPTYWTRFDISPSVMNRFKEYKRQVLANKRNTAALPGLLKRTYGDTYWYYFMFK